MSRDVFAMSRDVFDSVSCDVFDVVVIGGGPAGAVMGQLLAVRGLTVLVADAGSGRARVPEVLPPAAIPLLAALDLLTPLDRDGRLARRCLGIRRRWGGAEEVHDFLASPGGRGWIIDRVRLDELLAARARQASAVWLSPVRLREVAGAPGRWRLTFSTSGQRSETIAARFVIDASGRRRAFLRRLKVNTRRVSTLVSRFEAENDDSDPSSWLDVSASSQGWSYRASCPSGGSVRVSLFAPSRHTSGCYGSGRARAAGSQIAERCVGDGWGAIGDAAACFDPIASQGLSHAFASALVAAPAVATGLEQQDRSALRAYEAALRRTFWHSVNGARESYRVGLTRLGGNFWTRMSEAADPASR